MDGIQLNKKKEDMDNEPHEPHKVSEPQSALDKYRDDQKRDFQLNETKKALSKLYGFMSEYSAFTQQALNDFEKEHPEIYIQGLIEGIQ